MFEGYLELGGNEIVNSARSAGYLASGDCPSNWIVCPPCDGILDAAGGLPYTLANIADAPWYDEQEEASHRFLGVHALSIEGLMDSTRTASIAEGIVDGGVIGQVRHAVRQSRVRVLLSALGEDALESGLAWLKAALDPEYCGIHGSSCGATDSCFFIACPPSRSEITSLLPIWNTPVINLALNPSMETAGPAVVVATNLATNPSFETAGSSSVIVTATNLATNPSFEVIGNDKEVRRNLLLNPSLATVLTNWQFDGAARGVTTVVDTVAKAARFDNPTAWTGGVCVAFHAPVAVPSSAALVASIEVEVPPGYPAVTFNVTGRALSGGGTGPNSGNVTIQPGAKTRIAITHTSGVSGADLRLELWTDGSIGMPAGARFYVRNAIVETGTTHRTYFDGGTPAAGDFTHLWTASPNASASVENGKAVTGVSGNSGGLVVSSQEWKSSRTRSIRIISGGSANGAGRIAFTGLTVGAVYTARATMRLAVAQAAGSSTRARSIFVTSGTTFQSPQAPNAPGAYPLSITFTAGATTANVDLVAGGVVTGEEVWWDDFMVVEGNYTGPYFDGSGPPKVHRNLVLNPRAVTSGAHTWIAPVSGGVPVPASDSVQGSWTYEHDAAGTVHDFVRQTGLPGTTHYGYISTGFLSTPAVKDQQFAVRVKVRSSVALSVRIGMRWLPIGLLNYSPAVTLVPNQWTDLTFSYASIFDGTTSAEFSVQADPASIALGTGTFDVSQAVVEYGTTIPPYFDGATPALGLGAAWEGTVDASPSYLYDPAYTYAWTGTPDASSSTQSALVETVAGVTPPVVGQATVALTTDTPAAGSKAMRYTLAATTAIHLPVTDVPVASGTSYTLIGKVRPRTRTQVLAPEVGGAAGPSFTAPKDVWTSFKATIKAVAGGSAQTGLLLAGGSGHQVGDLIDIDEVTLVLGAVNAYFDGDTADAGGITYDWTGAPNASTSTQKGVPVANIGSPPVDQAVQIQTPDAPARGTYALRWIVQTAPAVSLPVVDLLPTSGEVYTLVGKVRPRTRTETLAPRIRNAAGPVFTAPKDVWTSFRLTIAAGTGSNAQTGLILASGSGHQPGDVIDIDEVMVIAGDYGDGTYFDGSFSDSPTSDFETPGAVLHDYGWTGTAHASTSTYRTGMVTETPDPVKYEEAVGLLQRTMHDVTCISGPLIEQKLHRNEMWGYIVEFTLAAGTPWLFGTTRDVIIPPGQVPIVVQDVPFNLVPYPSAELSSGTVIVATNYSTNPSVETAITGWQAGADGTKILAAQVAISRSVPPDDPASTGAYSAKSLFTANTTNTAGWFSAGQSVVLTGISAGKRYSINLWATASIQSGTAVLGNIDYYVYWQDAANAVLRTDLLGTLPAAGGAMSVKSILPPAGTTKAFVHARINVTSWSTGALIRLYADALAVTIP